MMRMVAIIAALVLTAFPQSTVDAAYADYYAQRAAGYETRYLWCRDQQEPVAKFVAVLASREPLLDPTVPVRLSGTNLLRLNLTALRWSIGDWTATMGHPANPYTANANQLIVPAGFFIDRISDGRTSDTYLRLYFGGDQIPRQRDDFLRALGVDPRQQRGLAFGLVEGSSHVNVARNGARLMRHDDGVHSESWTTFDVRQVAPGADPLESLDTSFRFDASEIFGLVPKVSTTGVRGLFPVVALANAQGKLVAEAPIDIVRDTTEFKGQAAIVSPGSCIQCHTAGSQRPNVNALRDRLSKGVDLLTYDQRKRIEIELFHLGSVDETLDRWDVGYTAALAYINGMTPQANAAAFQAVVNNYHADVTLEVAAAELHCEPATLRLALGYASANKVLMSNRLAGIAHDIAAPRTAWEQDYLRAAELVRLWRAANR